MMKLTMTVVAILTGCAPAQAKPWKVRPAPQATTRQSYIPSCDAFMQRLRGAGRALTISLPPVKLERSPYSRTGIETFGVSYEYNKNVVFEGTLKCVDSQLEDFQMDAPHDDRFHAVNAVAAALYAYIGFQFGFTPQLHMENAKSIIDSQPKTCVPNNCESEDWELPDGNLSIGLAFFLIQTDADACRKHPDGTPVYPDFTTPDGTIVHCDFSYTKPDGTVVRRGEQEAPK